MRSKTHLLLFIHYTHGTVNLKTCHRCEELKWKNDPISVWRWLIEHSRSCSSILIHPSLPGQTQGQEETDFFLVTWILVSLHVVFNNTIKSILFTMLRTELFISMRTLVSLSRAVGEYKVTRFWNENWGHFYFSSRPTVSFKLLNLINTNEKGWINILWNSWSYYFSYMFSSAQTFWAVQSSL